MSWIAAPISDNPERKLCQTIVPNNTKSATDWRIRVWNEWASSRLESAHNVDGDVVNEQLHC